MGNVFGAVDTIMTVGAILLVVLVFCQRRIRALRLRFASSGVAATATRPPTATPRPTPRVRRPAPVVPTSTAPVPTLRQPVPKPDPRSLPLSTWWHGVVAHDAHVLIVGETRAGKSTTARALLAERARTDAILIVDPHEKFADWSGLPVVGIGRDIDAIERAFQDIHREFERRFRSGEDVGEPLTIFVDEFPALAALRPALVTLVKQWVRESAKARMRFVFLTQSRSVKSLGIEGEGDIRKSLMSVLLGTFAAEASEIAARDERPAVLERYGGVTAVSVTGLPFYAARSIDPSVMWSVPAQTSEAIPDPMPETVLEPDTAMEWTAAHVKVAVWITQEPTISTREIARRLHPGTNGGGDYSLRAKRIRQQVEAVSREGVSSVLEQENAGNNTVLTG